jgi:hypothetical protein
VSTDMLAFTMIIFDTLVIVIFGALAISSDIKNCKRIKSLELREKLSVLELVKNDRLS